MKQSRKLTEEELRKLDEEFADWGSLTSEQIKAMPAGPELDAAAHHAWHPEDVIEWRWCQYRLDNGLPLFVFDGQPHEWMLKKLDFRFLPCHKVNGEWQPIPAYSTDGNAMLALKDRMKSDNYLCGTRPITTPEGGWIVEVWNYSVLVGRSIGLLTEPHAVAIAALLAKENVGEDS